ncbi:MAG TPA: M24 family metallopeptidase [Gaiellaceae bacterium]|nr:M24 family metallopeptidase [Gaiellaceae bacterium]
MAALLLHGYTERSAALRHEIPLAIIDPLLFAEVDGRTYVLTSFLEAERVKRVLPGVELLDFFELGYKDLVRDGMSFRDAAREVEARAVREIGLTEAIVPGDFPLGLGDRLRQDGVVLTVDDAAVDLRRRTKTPTELDGMRAAQRAAEAAMAAAADLLARAEPAEDGLRVDGKALLAEDVRATLRSVAADHGAPCPPDIIVASVWQGGGHEPGSGPLPAGLPIHIDLWPRDEESACWADMARTFVVGDPMPEHAELIAEMTRLALEALKQAEGAVRTGITGLELYDATCDLFEAAGWATQRTSGAKTGPDGFQHSLGHGVGLEVHEAPPLGLAGHDALVPGDVVAIEPGLNDLQVGVVIFEDLVLVTEDGHEVLTRFPYDLSPAQG